MSWPTWEQPMQEERKKKKKWCQRSTGNKQKNQRGSHPIINERRRSTTFHDYNGLSDRAIGYPRTQRPILLPWISSVNYIAKVQIWADQPCHSLLWEIRLYLRNQRLYSEKNKLRESSKHTLICIFEYFPRSSIFWHNRCINQRTALTSRYTSWLTFVR
jgi:hypothetical protein